MKSKLKKMNSLKESLRLNESEAVVNTELNETSVLVSNVLNEVWNQDFISQQLTIDESERGTEYKTNLDYVFNSGSFLDKSKTTDTNEDDMNLKLFNTNYLNYEEYMQNEQFFNCNFGKIMDTQKIVNICMELSENQYKDNDLNIESIFNREEINEPKKSQLHVTSLMTEYFNEKIGLPNADKTFSIDKGYQTLESTVQRDVKQKEPTIEENMQIAYDNKFDYSISNDDADTDSDMYRDWLGVVSTIMKSEYQEDLKYFKRTVGPKQWNVDDSNLFLKGNDICGEMKKKNSDIDRNLEKVTEQEKYPILSQEDEKYFSPINANAHCTITPPFFYTPETATFRNNNSTSTFYEENYINVQKDTLWELESVNHSIEATNKMSVEDQVVPEGSSANSVAVFTEMNEEDKELFNKMVTIQSLDDGYLSILHEQISSNSMSNELQKMKNDLIVIARKTFCFNNLSSKNNGPVKSSSKQLTAFTPGGQKYLINLSLMKPQKFKTKIHEEMWNSAVHINSRRLRYMIHTGEYIPPELDRRREQEEAEARSLRRKKAKLGAQLFNPVLTTDLEYLIMLRALLNLDRDLKQYILTDPPLVLNSFESVKTLGIKPICFLLVPQLYDTLTKIVGAPQVLEDIKQKGFDLISYIQEAFNKPPFEKVEGYFKSLVENFHKSTKHVAIFNKLFFNDSGQLKSPGLLLSKLKEADSQVTARSHFIKLVSTNNVDLNQKEEYVVPEISEEELIWNVE